MKRDIYNLNKEAIEKIRLSFAETGIDLSVVSSLNCFFFNFKIPLFDDILVYNCFKNCMNRPPLGFRSEKAAVEFVKIFNFDEQKIVSKFNSDLAIINNISKKILGIDMGIPVFNNLKSIYDDFFYTYGHNKFHQLSKTFGFLDTQISFHIFLKFDFLSLEFSHSVEYQFDNEYNNNIDKLLYDIEQKLYRKYIDKPFQELSDEELDIILMIRY